MNIKIKKNLIFQRFVPIEGVPHFLFKDELGYKLYLPIEDKPALMADLQKGQSVYIEGNITIPIKTDWEKGHLLEDVTYILNKDINISSEDEDDAEDAFIGGGHD